MRLLTPISALVLALLQPLTPTVAPAQQLALSEEGFRAFLPQLRTQAAAAGVSRATLDRAFASMTFSPRTVELDRAQPGGTTGYSAIPAFAPYEREHVNAELIRRGAARYRADYAQLSAIGRKYGVTPSVLVAIWGHETSYGAVTGNFDLLNSLASLAYEGRRRQLFTDEFIATLKLMDKGYTRSQLKGSWAGATGYPQFLPSVFLRLGVDGDGDGRSNIWSNEVDALASIANYLDNAGWKPNVPWGVKVNVPASVSSSEQRSLLVSPRCPRVHERHSKWRTIDEWRALGLVSQSGNWPNGRELASLLEPDGPGRTGYLLTTNYRTILDYNCSNFYALSVGLLADAVSR